MQIPVATLLLLTNYPIWTKCRLSPSVEGAAVITGFGGLEGERRSRAEPARGPRPRSGKGLGGGGVGSGKTPASRRVALDFGLRPESSGSDAGNGRLALVARGSPA